MEVPVCFDNCISKYKEDSVDSFFTVSNSDKLKSFTKLNSDNSMYGNSENNSYSSEISVIHHKYACVEEDTTNNSLLTTVGKLPKQISSYNVINKRKIIITSEPSHGNLESEDKLFKQSMIKKSVTAKSSTGQNIEQNTQKIVSYQCSANEPSAMHYEFLKNNFGHTTFRPIQWKIIHSIIYKRQDNLAVMATGYGKSLCYQYPAIFLDGIILVVSPLISLMEDQVLSLKVANISACLLGSAQTNKNILPSVFKGDYKIVYVSPEYMSLHRKYLLHNMKQKLSLIAIDEAHCISQWGHDFRPSFRELNKIRDIITNEIPILAVTATAPEKVQEDIINSLQLINPQIICTGVDRPNLEFIIQHKGRKYTKMKSIVQLIKSCSGGSIIIYCLTRNETEEIAGDLNKFNIKCAAYHAGKPLEVRTKVHELFVKDKINLVVATIAFGMGIDKPDVRLIIHYGSPKNMECYYQEIGRAGRDGLPAKCILFYDDDDFELHEFFREKLKLNYNRQNERKKSEHMKQFLLSLECRRSQILKYFEDVVVNCERRINCCDNCRKYFSRLSSHERILNEQKSLLYDFTNDAKLLLQSMKLFSDPRLEDPVLLLVGSNSEMLSNVYRTNQLYGAGKQKSKSYWYTLVKQLQQYSYINSPIDSSITKKISITQKTETWLHSNELLKLLPIEQMRQYINVTVTTDKREEKNNVENCNSDDDGESSDDESQHLNSELLKNLMVKRTELANKFDVMPYMIASKLAIHQLEQIKPLNLQEISDANIDGFSDAKIIKFGNDLLQCLIQYQKSLFPTLTAIDSNIYLTNKNDGSNGTQFIKHTMLKLLNKYPLINNNNCTDKDIKIAEMIQNNRSIEEITDKHEITESTLLYRVNRLIKCGFVITQQNLEMFQITKDIFNKIRSKLPNKNLMNVRLITIKEQLQEQSLSSSLNITYDMISLVLSYFQVREHLNKLQLNYNDPDNELFFIQKFDNDINSTNIKINKIIENEKNENKMDSDDDVFLYDIDEVNISNNNHNDNNKKNNNAIYNKENNIIDLLEEDNDFINNITQNELILNEKTMNSQTQLKRKLSLSDDSNSQLIDGKILRKNKSNEF